MFFRAFQATGKGHSESAEPLLQIPALVFGHGCWHGNKHKADGCEPQKAGIVAWTYMELLLVEFIQNEPADYVVGGKSGSVSLM